MQQEQASLNKKYQWLEMVEGLAVIGSFGGTIASIVFQQAVLASVPLSLSVMLNVVNRRLLFNSLNDQENAIAQTLEADSFVTQDQFTSIRNQLAQLQEKGVTLSRNQDQLNDAIAQIGQENNTTRHKIEQMIALASPPINSKTDAHNQMPSEDIQNLLSTQATINKTLQTLKQIDVYSQAIQLNPTAEAYYNRGLSYESLSEQQAAIGDYSAAIRLDSNYAEAYLRRGLAYIELGNKKEAIKDLRTAAKFYFAQGDIDKYQQAKELTKQLHELNSPTHTDASTRVIESLFAAASS